MLRPGRFVALLAVAASLPAVPARAAQCAGAAAAARSGRWFTASPPLPDRSATHRQLFGQVRYVRTIGVDPADPRILFVTDGDHVHRSDDGGCRWTLVWRLPERTPDDPAAPDRDVAEITSIDVARVGRQTRVLLAGLSLGRGMPGSTRTFLVRSGDGRSGWALTGSPVDLVGTHDPQRGPSWSPVVHSAGAVAYAAVPSHEGTVAYLRSNDGGKTWATKTSVVTTESPTSMTGIAVNPLNPDEVWEWGGVANRRQEELSGLRYTPDGGVRWYAVDPWPMVKTGTKPTWHSADITWPVRGGAARILVLGGVNDPRSPDLPPVLSWSGNAGKSFTQVVPPASIPSLVKAAVAHTRDGNVVLVAHNGLTFRLTCRTRAPRASDWRLLPMPKVKPDGEWSLLGHDLARASATSPSVLVLPTWKNVQLLAVAP